MEKLEKQPINVPIVRHLEDVDDLIRFGRDGDLIPGQESEAKNIAEKFIEECKKEGKEAIILVCSSRKRGVKTAEAVAGAIRAIDKDIKVRIAEEDALASIYEGEFILPDDYKAGDPFLGLPIANKIFNNEAFESNPPNDLYKFGDPVLLQNGSYKYPELLPYFKSYGESNRDIMLRTYLLIIQTYEKIHKLNSKTKVVVITHAQHYQIFRNLSIIAKKVIDEGFKFNVGEIPRLCWKLYKERSMTVKPTYDINFIPVEELCSSETIKLLKDELRYLDELQ